MTIDIWSKDIRYIQRKGNIQSAIYNFRLLSFKIQGIGLVGQMIRQKPNYRKVNRF